MAKFSQALLQGLLQPTYQQGLFEAARNVGQAPGVVGFQKKRDERMEQFQSMNPLQRAEYMMGRAKTPREMVMAQTMMDKATAEAGNTVIQPLLTELSNPETTEERAKELRVEIFEAARREGVKEAVVRESFNTANKSRITVGYEQLLRETQELSIVAKQAISANTSRDAFVAQYGEENGYIYDDEKDLKETGLLNLQAAKEKAKEATFQYSDEEMENLGLSAEQIKVAKGMKTGKAKNAAVLAAVSANFKRDTNLNASLLNFMADARVADIAERDNLDLEDKDDVIIARSTAKKEVLEMYRSGGLSAVISAQATATGDTTSSTLVIETDAQIGDLYTELGLTE